MSSEQENVIGIISLILSLNDNYNLKRLSKIESTCNNYLLEMNKKHLRMNWGSILKKMLDFANNRNS